MNSPQVLTLSNSVLIPQIKKLIDAGRIAEFRVRGYSMRLFVEHERDSVVLAPVTRPLRRYDVVLAEVAPQLYVLHRIIRVEGDDITLMGDGNIRGTEHCRRQDVIGLAIGFKRKGREKMDSTDALKWRIYSRLWVPLLPLRRYILGVYRRIWLPLTHKTL